MDHAEKCFSRLISTPTCIGHAHVHQSVCPFSCWLKLTARRCIPKAVKFCPADFQICDCGICWAPYRLWWKCLRRPICNCSLKISIKFHDDWTCGYWFMSNLLEAPLFEMTLWLITSNVFWPVLLIHNRNVYLCRTMLCTKCCVDCVKYEKVDVTCLC